ncbi:TolC family protein [Sphingomonas sp. CCH16-B10]|uniref:TolC family protein n=1 Tax=Sphingomonas sp. CCH16-B10 TaxID=1768755 RepID=UPI000834EC1E|nr:TolC family protein [Sphingomonas sp. CCH16-B10]
MSRRHLLSGLSATALALAACAPVERPPAPGSIALPDAFALLDRQASASGTLPDLLPSQDPAFVALNARAMADAPELAIAVARIDAARAGLRGAGAERLPNITAGGDGSRRRISAAQFAGLPDGIEIQRYVSNFSASADASWDIDLFGRLRAGQRAAAARLDAATADAAAVRLALATDIARAVLDYPADTILAALEPAQPVPAITPGLPTLEVPSVLLRRRPDVAAAERRLAAADADIAAAAAERFPTFSITGSIGLLALAFGDLFNEEAITGSLGGSIAGPLLDFGRIGARIDQREAEAREAFATYRRALFTALGETEAALGALDAAAKRAGALSRQAELDRDAAQLARERYRRGLDTFLTVLDAERTSYASRQSAITAQAEVARARVALYRAVGGEG